MDVKTTLVGIILLGFFNIVDTQVTVPEPDIEACHGEDVLLTWIFSDEQDLDTAQWKKGTTLIMTKVGAGAAVAAAGYTSKFQHVSNGEIRLLNTELTDTATYQLDVSYSLTSGLPSDFGSLNVKALDPPSSPTGFCTDGSTRMCYCRASYIGSPAVDVRIKVDEDLKSTANSSILSTETAYCCVVGEAVKCLEKECVIIAGPECCCCCICCFIVLIVSGALSILFAGGHIGLTWKNHEFSVKKIHSNEAVCLKDFGIKAALPESCNCVGTIVIHIAVYFAALAKDCNKDCDDCCGVVICLVVTIIVSVVKAAIGPGIIYLFVYVKGCNYVDQAGQPVPTSNGQVELSAKT